MSIPGWKEQSPFGRQRGPNGLVTGPATGQIRPDDDGAGGLLEPVVVDGELAAAWVVAAA
jgi:hypothetical protein